MPTILGANSASDSYEVANSVRFDDPGGTRLIFTPSGAGSRTTFTFSCWVKRSVISNRAVLFRTAGNSDSTTFEFILHQSNYLMLGLNSFNVFETDMVFRDPSAWYHIVLAMDSTQGSSDNRTKLYVNGVRNTSFRATNLNSISSNYNFGIGQSGVGHSMGAGATGGDPLDGYMAEINYVDGTALDSSYFGETNTNGVWVPKEPDVSNYGDNGFYLEFKQSGTNQNSSGIGADTSGKDNHVGITNMASNHQTVDTPTNNFCTWNALYKNSGNAAYTPSSISDGALKLTLQNDSAIIGTMGVSSGKWYWEYKLAENTADNQDYPIFGFASNSHTSSASNLIGRGTSSGGTSRGNVGSARVSNAFDDASLSANDIIGFYLDLDNETLKLYKNGSDWMGSGATNGLDISSASYANEPTDGFFYPYTQNNGLSITGDQANFGNPGFTLSSAVSDANGYGNFEYNPTIGGVNYYALCTKNLAEYG